MIRRRPPWALVPLAAVAAAFFVLPPWSSAVGHVTAPEARTALRLSVECSLVAVALSLVLGVPLAWLFARVPFPGRTALRALVTLPILLPPVVGGVALLMAFGRRGVAGRLLDRFLGVTLPLTTAGAVVAATFVALPFLVVTVEAGLRQMDRRYEDASATLGAGPWTTFWRGTLPLVAPSLRAAAALAGARALGEFGATITFAGNLRGRTQTLPLYVYLALETDPGAAIVLSIVLAVSVAVLLTLRDRWLGAT